MENIFLILLLLFAFFVVFYAYTPVLQGDGKIIAELDTVGAKTDSCLVVGENNGEDVISQLNYFVCSK